MTIALIAHDSKKELMVQFCIAYCGILCHHHLCATGSTGKYISDATGLEIETYLAGTSGTEQIASISSTALFFSIINARTISRCRWACSICGK